MSVSEILAGKGSDVTTAAASDKLSDIAKILAEHKIGALVILEGKSVVGIASERDIVRLVAQKGAGALDLPISICMTKNVVSCVRSDTNDDVMEKMTKGRFRHLPVIESDELMGIISIGDVVKRKIEQAERDAEELKRYISS